MEIKEEIVRTQPALRIHLLVAGLAVVLAACGSGGDGPAAPPEDVLATVEVTPPTAAIFNKAPGNTVTLAVTAKDQDGAIITGTRSFESSNTAVATVSATGIVTAVAGGTAQITASVTVGSVTKSATTAITVQVPPATAGVTAPALAYLPAQVHVAAGGVVTWTIGAIHHTITFVSAGSPLDIPEIIETSAARTFPSSGSFNYVCSIHSTMSGTVHVH